MTVERAGEGAGGRRRRWSRGRVWGVLGGEGDLARGIAIEREGDRDRVPLVVLQKSKKNK